MVVGQRSGGHSPVAEQDPVATTKEGVVSAFNHESQPTRLVNSQSSIQDSVAST